MTQKILILLMLLILISCQKQSKNDILKSSKWLIGKWENKSDGGHLLETWNKTNDSIFNGESYFIKGNDTLHSEKIELKQKGDKLLYISSIKGQNNDKPITFSHKIEFHKQLVFENPNSDYPRKIIYQRFSKAHLLIEISGMHQGKPSSTRYTLKKTD